MQTFEIKREPSIEDDLLAELKKSSQSYGALTISCESGDPRAIQSFEIHGIQEKGIETVSIRLTRIDGKPNHLLGEVFDEAAAVTPVKLDQFRDNFFSRLLSEYMMNHRGESFKIGAVGTLD